MKKLLFSLLLLSSSVFAQFPVTVRNASLYRGIEDFVSIEGNPPSVGVTGYTPASYLFDGVMTPSGNGVNPGTIASNIGVGGVTRPALTKRIFIDGLMAWASEPIFARISVDGANNVYQGVIPSAPTVIATPFFLHANQALGMNIKGRVNAGTGGVVASITARATTLSADVEYSAPYSMLILGDSNTEGTAVQDATSAWDVYTWIVKRKFSEAGKRIRLIDKSTAGYTTQHYEDFRLQGYLELPFQPSIIVYNLGTNNPGRVDDALYSAHVQNIIDYKKHRYPDSVLIIIGVCPNNESSGKQTVLASQRTTAQSLISTANQGVPTTSTQYVEYCEFGNLFATNAGSTYFTTSAMDGNGNVHMNKAAQVLAGNRFWEVIVANNQRIFKKIKPQ